MSHRILGLHHVTATVDAAQADLDFCVGALGLRLVKKTVNFDNHDVYHFYYGDERGTPGTIWTTFPYKGKGVPIGRKGAGQVAVTSFSVPAGSLPFWTERLTARTIEAKPAPSRFGEQGILFSDPSGLLFELIETSRDVRTPWAGGGVAADVAIRGIHGVTMIVQSSEATLKLMTELLGFVIVDRAEGRVRVAAGIGGPGHAIDILDAPLSPAAQNGLGTVHHVAFAIATPDEQLRVREDLLARGLRVTPVMDRCYFQSIYFREPGGVLFEIATVTPGFTSDEVVEDLGRGLKLPPWEEPHRSAIEGALPVVTTARKPTPGVVTAPAGDVR